MVRDHLLEEGTTEEDLISGAREMVETRQKSIAQRYLEFLEKPTKSSFLAFNFCWAWFAM